MQKFSVSEKSITNWLMTGDGPFTLSEIQTDLKKTNVHINMFSWRVTPFLKKLGYARKQLSINGSQKFVWLEQEKLEPNSEWFQKYRARKFNFS